jgi:acyl-CoA synthetase (NDP forming)
MTVLGTDRPVGLASLFAPRGVAVVGASRDPGKLGAALARSLEGFAGRGGHVALVNGRDPAMHGSLASAAAAGPLDLAMICVPAAACPGVLADAAAAGCGAAVIHGGGFAEAGGSGVALQAEIAGVAAASGIRVLGPNTSGFVAPHAGLAASFVPGAAALAAGPVALVAASGGVNHALAFLLAEAGHGVSLAVGLGNAVDVAAPDVLRHLAESPDTTAVALHVESVTDGRALVAAVRAVTARKPVVALVVGRNDVGAFAASHTGALATSWRTTRAALAQAGAVLVDDERQLVDAVAALSVRRAPAHPEPGVGVVTAQAGPGLLLLDDLRGRGARVPELGEPARERLSALLPPLTYQRNPVDTGRPTAAFGEVLATVAADPDVDVLAAYALHEPGAVDLAAAVRTATAATGVPLVLGVGGAGVDVARQRRELAAAGVVVAADPRGVVNATAALLADARHRFRLAAGAGDETGSGGPDATRLAPLPDPGPGPHDEAAAKRVLQRLGIATPRRRACDDRQAAHEALAELTRPEVAPGGAVAVKLLDAAVLHKTEVGGVHLGVRTPDELDAALDTLEAAGARRFLVEAMAPPGVDLVVGARRDPVFGPVVLVGLGGVTAEVLADVSVRLAPLSPAEARTMPSELAGRALLAGWRGGPVLADDDLARVVVALGDLVAARPAVAEIEINPLRLTATGLLALDAVIVTREAEDAHPHQ